MNMMHSRRLAKVERVIDGYRAGRDWLRGSPSLACIMEQVATKHGVTVDEIKGHRRGAKVLAARFEFYARAVAETGKSFPEIGRFCRRDHSTVYASTVGKRARRRRGLPA